VIEITNSALFSPFGPNSCRRHLRLWRKV